MKYAEVKHGGKLTENVISDGLSDFRNKTFSIEDVSSDILQSFVDSAEVTYSSASNKYAIRLYKMSYISHIYLTKSGTIGFGDVVTCGQCDFNEEEDAKEALAKFSYRAGLVIGGRFMGQLANSVPAIDAIDFGGDKEMEAVFRKYSAV